MDAQEIGRIRERLDKLAAGELQDLHTELEASVHLAHALKDDFRRCLQAALETNIPQHKRRDIARCFGSLVEGYTASMRMAAIGVCKIFDKPLNPFLQEKAIDRNLSVYHRLHSIYRLLAEFLPKSPFAHLPDERWNDLRIALEIRNRIVHPRTLQDLELSNGEIAGVMQVGLDFVQDFSKFVQWFSQTEQKLLWELPMQRKRYVAKVGRNEKCPCGSKLKFKNCCGAAQV